MKNRKKSLSHNRKLLNRKGAPIIKTIGKVSKQQPIKPKKAWIPFTSSDKVLLVGEGDLSFSLCLLENNLCSSITGTCFDTQQQVLDKYPEKAKEVIDKISEFENSKIIFEIDATKLSSYKKKITSHDLVVFNFPHIGNSMSDQNRNIRQHQELMLKFFKSAQEVAPRIIVTLWEGEPYESWQIKKLARSVGLHLQQSGKFSWKSYEGYNHVLTAKVGNTTKPQTSRDARMYLFSKDKVVNISKKKHDDFSDDD